MGDALLIADLLQSHYHEPEFEVWRENDGSYCYVAIEVVADHDTEQFYLLDVRTKRAEAAHETRDYLYVYTFLGGRDVEWFNQPYDTSAPFEDYIAHLSAGMRWFSDHLVGDRETAIKAEWTHETGWVSTRPLRW